MSLDSIKLVDHHNYDLWSGQLPSGQPIKLIRAKTGEGIRYLQSTSHIINVNPPKAEDTTWPYVKLWLVDTEALPHQTVSESTFFLGGEPFAHEYALGERMIPFSCELWGQASPGANLNYWIWTKEQK